ncbi:MAG: hypothetical protein ACE5MH_02645 [Terriglobia bacterium]
MNLRTVLAALIGLGLVGGVAVGAWYVLHEPSPVFCQISGRPIHANMHTLVQINGEKLYACCPRCPLTVAAQAGKQSRILEVTDYVSGERLPASEAYFVAGSRVEVCSAPRLRVDESRTPYVRLFDRCGPSLLAFAREGEARDFIVNYGGGLKRLGELMRETLSRQPPAGER